MTRVEINGDRVVMSFFKSSRSIETKIDDFFDTVAKGGLAYRAGVRAYLAGDTADFENAMVSINKLEVQADKLSKVISISASAS